MTVYDFEFDTTPRPSVCGGCGEPTPPENLVMDLGCTNLCPECLRAAAIPCAVCGREVPVKIYATDGFPDPTGEVIPLRLPDGSVYEVDDVHGIEEYLAICSDCDNPEGVMR